MKLMEVNQGCGHHAESAVAQEMSCSEVRYSQVWEDEALLTQGLMLHPDDDILSIGSAGCNVLAMLLKQPKSIIAVDFSPAQVALMELKFKAIEQLSYADFVVLTGLRAGDRLQLFSQLKAHLSTTTVAFWEQRKQTLRDGFIFSGRLEQYFRRFQQDYLAQIWSAEEIQGLLSADSLQQQQSLFDKMIARLEKSFCWYFGQENLQQEGRDPAQFRYVKEQNVGQHFLDRFRYACTQLPTFGNHHLEFFLTSNYRDLENGPLYLQKANFEKLKPLINRITVVRGELEKVLACMPVGHFSKANFSDVFEYMSKASSDVVFDLVAKKLKPGGRIAYWNLLIPRKSDSRQLHYQQSLSHQLWKRDRSWFYRDFIIEKKALTC